MTKRILLVALLLLSTKGFAQADRQIDSIAVRLLDKMTAVIGEMPALSVDLETAIDKQNDLRENERFHSQHELHFSGPDKMTIHSRGDNGNKAIWYNGKFLTYYSYDENNYVTVEAPETTIDMIDDMNTRFGIKFPGADLFFPSLTEDVLDIFDHLKYLGKKTVDGQECFHLMASNKDMNFQVWISNNSMYLPKKYLFLDKKNHHQQFEGTFSNWRLNPFIPDTVFEFTPPKNARLISILSKS
jgi:hypothetical protein